MRVLFSMLLVVGVMASAARTASCAEIKIGVVNIREILARYKKYEDLQKKSVESFTSKRDALENRRDELARHVAELQAHPGSEQDPDRMRATKEIETTEFMLKLDYRELQREMQKSGDRITRHVIEEIGAACGRIGDAQGYYLIIKRFGPDPANKDDREHIDAFKLDPLLYYSPDADITQSILALLEDAYSQGIRLVPNDLVEDLLDGDE